MNRFVQALEELANTNSAKEKENILKRYDCKELREYLDICLNSYRCFYVRTIPTSKKEGKATFPIAGKGFTSFKNLCESLERREISGDVASNTTFEVFSKFTKQEYNWFRAALTKEAIGVGRTIVNKAFGNIIPTFEVMLADNKQPNLDKITYPVVYQPKFDGFRAVYYPGLGFLGRNGKKIRNENLEKYFGYLSDITDFVFDGELYSHSIGFNELASILNSEDKHIPSHLEYVIFDGMSKKDWDSQDCKFGYQDRIGNIFKVLKANGLYGKGYSLAIPRHGVVNSAEEVINEYRGTLKEGYEGAMLKDPNGLYQWKRVRLSSQTMIKLKPSVTHDLKVIGFEEGKGKLKGSLGKIIVDFKGIKVGVGSGFKEEERDEIWQNKAGFKGIFAEVKAMGETEDSSLRHPIFVRWRTDKSE